MDARVNITLPPDLLHQADEAARAEHLTRSGFVREALKVRLSSGVPGTPEARSVLAEESPAAYAVKPAGPPSLEVVVDRLRAFCSARDDIVLAYVFGSVAAGTAGSNSDVDIAVLLPYEGTDRVSRFRAQLDLTGRLERVFHARRVDVLILNDAPYALAARSALNGRIAYGDDRSERDEFEIRTFNLYAEFRRVEEDHMRGMIERVRSGEFLAR
jgi:predicted nucleotidyltransferase